MLDPSCWVGYSCKSPHECKDYDFAWKRVQNQRQPILVRLDAHNLLVALNTLWTFTEKASLPISPQKIGIICLTIIPYYNVLNDESKQKLNTHFNISLNLIFITICRTINYCIRERKGALDPLFTELILHLNARMGSATPSPAPERFLLYYIHYFWSQFEIPFLPVSDPEFKLQLDELIRHIQASLISRFI